jgi:hypothetical protein
MILIQIKIRSPLMKLADMYFRQIDYEFDQLTPAQSGA